MPRRGDLCIENGTDEAGHGEQHLEILARGVHHLHGAGGGERSGERRQAGQRQRVDAVGALLGGRLHQAELGAVGALAQELGVEGDGGGGAQVGGKVVECGGRGDQGLQRFRG
jgi:hypothetical protein